LDVFVVVLVVGLIPTSEPYKLCLLQYG
jgi:hypothetical protein